MDAEYAYVDIVFENCNFVRIPPEHILTFYFGEICETLSANCIGQLMEHRYAKKFYIRLKNEALEIKTRFEQDHLSDISSFKHHLEKFHDITSIDIVNLDGSSQDIGVLWESDDSYYTNKLEKVEWKDKWFVITIEE